MCSFYYIIIYLLLLVIIMQHIVKIGLVTEISVPNYQSLFFKLTQLAELSQKICEKPQVALKQYKCEKCTHAHEKRKHQNLIKPGKEITTLAWSYVNLQTTTSSPFPTLHFTLHDFLLAYLQKYLYIPYPPGCNQEPEIPYLLPLWIDWQTPVDKIPFRNFVGGR